MLDFLVYYLASESDICNQFDFCLEIGHYLHPCEADLVVRCTKEENVPYFNAPIFLENKQQVGKVDEIFGPITEFISFSHFERVSINTILLSLNWKIFTRFP